MTIKNARPTEEELKAAAQVEIEPRGWQVSAASKIKDVDLDAGRVLYGALEAAPGEQVDEWATYVEGHGDKAPQMLVLYTNHVEGRKIRRHTQKPQVLTGKGVGARRMDVVIHKRGAVTVAVNIATQGEDLVVSMRSFISSRLNWVAIGLLAIPSAFLLLCGLCSGISLMSADSGTEYGFDYGTDMAAVGWGCMVTMAVLAALPYIIAGYLGTVRKGSLMAFFILPPDELRFDEAYALSSAVHRSILYAADQLDIDTTKLEPHEPHYKRRRAPRL